MSESSRAAKRKREQRQRKRDGHLLLQIQIEDGEAWLECMKEDRLIDRAATLDDNRAICKATEVYIAEECQGYRNERAEEEWGSTLKMRVGRLEADTPAGMTGGDSAAAVGGHGFGDRVGKGIVDEATSRCSPQQAQGPLLQPPKT